MYNYDSFKRLINQCINPPQSFWSEENQKEYMEFLKEIENKFKKSLSEIETILQSNSNERSELESALQESIKQKFGL